MATARSVIHWFYHEFGLASLHATGRNAYLIILARTCRMFAYGANALILGMQQLFNYSFISPIIATAESTNVSQ